MKNLSTNNETLELNVGKSYLIIDALYLQEIKNEFEDTNIRDIRSKIFPYTSTPFAQVKILKKIFFVNQIKKVGHNKVVPNDYSFFSTDTGLIIFISEDIVIEFLKNYSYEDLVNSEDETINKKYWENLISRFDTADLAIILSYVKSENNFDGSGTYKIS